MNVTIKQKRGSVALVEWYEDGGVSRGFVPVADIHNGECDIDVLYRAVPYGMPWRSMCPNNGDAIERELHKAGIWTATELLARPDLARRAFCDAFGDDWKALLEAVHANPGS